MKRFLLAIALTSVLSVSALAGEMPGVGAPAPALPGDTQGPSIAATVILTILSLVR
jgi:hypothetical protein